MSVASSAVRAGIREAGGNGRSAVDASATSTTSSRHLLLPNLTPDPNEILKLLKGQKIEKKDGKFQAFKSIWALKPVLSSHMDTITPGSSAECDGGMLPDGGMSRAWTT